MKSLNKVTVLGYLGKEPEIKHAANGNAIANLSVATSEQWNDKATGQKQEKTEWHRVVVFGKLAEIVQQYLAKGSKVYLEGKLQTRKWQDKATGQDRYSTEIVVDGFNGNLIMLDSKPNEQPQPQGFQQPQMNQNQNSLQQAPAIDNDFDDAPF